MKKTMKFIENYEKYIMPLREKYYKTILQQKNSKDGKKILLLFKYIPFLISLIILVINSFTTKGYTISVIFILLVNIFIKFLVKYLNIENTNSYLEAIRKQGFLTIQDYEKKLKEIVTGPNGYYYQILEELKSKYNITDQNVRKITTTSNDEYYIWTNAKQDKINILNTKTNKHPNIETIKISNIRYYRIDNEKQCIVLKTDTNIFYLKKENISILNDIIKNKRLENITTFEPELYINDFEIFMHKIKKDINSNNQYETDKLSNNINKLLISFIILMISIFIKNILSTYQLIITIISIISLYILCTSLYELIIYKGKRKLTEDEEISILNRIPECIENFKELKYALGIYDNYDKIYTKDKICYITWSKNGYFHLFLNLIYYNVVYMSIKPSDVRYYKVDNKECEIKLKDKTLVFSKEAGEVFGKILPNKDYNWLKNYQKN